MARRPAPAGPGRQQPGARPGAKTNPDRASARTEKTKRAAAGPATATTTPLLPTPLYQSILDVFSAALFAPRPSAQPAGSGSGSGSGPGPGPGTALSPLAPPAPAFAPQLQAVKTHLFARDFAAAFAPPHLPVYAARWSPARALAYASVLVDLARPLGLLRPAEPDTAPPPAPFRLVGLGAGAGGELVGLAAALAQLSRGAPGPARAEASLVDSAAWGPVLAALAGALAPEFPPGGRDCDGGAAAAGGAVTYSFHQADLLLPHATAFPALPGLLGSADLITLCFTLNELFADSKAGATRLLLDLGVHTRPGTVLLVLDSPGYGVVGLSAAGASGGGGGQQRQYAMGWILDHLLLKTAPTMSAGADVWEKLIEEEARWFRVPDGLCYPTGQEVPEVRLENMRMQVHVYKRL